MTVEILLVSLVVVYLITATYFFISWLNLSPSDFSFSLQEDFLVLTDVLIAALLWPVIAPIADVHFFD
jgi:hypothetical protein